MSLDGIFFTDAKYVSNVKWVVSQLKIWNPVKEQVHISTQHSIILIVFKHYAVLANNSRIKMESKALLNGMPKFDVHTAETFQNQHMSDLIVHILDLIA